MVNAPSTDSNRNHSADGDLTSGQYPPLFDKINTDIASFPKSLEGPTVWRREDYINSPDKWIHRWTQEEIDDLSRAADEFAAKGLSLTQISQENFVLGRKLAARLETTRQDLIHGKGFALFKGFPTTEWSVEKIATAYTGLGSYLGEFLSQNGKGHILGHVKDLGNDPTQIDKVRIYSTNAKQFFHVDDADIIGLLCLHRAKEGGESDILSSHHLYNILQKERPDVLQTFITPDWYWDRKGEVSNGQEPYYKAAIIYNYEGHVILKWDPYFVRSLQRFSDKGEIPPLSEKQLEAMRALEEIANREALHMVLEVGDIQLVSGTFVLHARTAYTDHLPPAPKRQLMRLWLATPEYDGGWKLPFHDSHKKRRGGIQVNENPHTSPLDAE